MCYVVWAKVETTWFLVETTWFLLLIILRSTFAGRRPLKVISRFCCTRKYITINNQRTKIWTRGSSHWIFFCESWRSFFKPFGIWIAYKILLSHALVPIKEFIWNESNGPTQSFVIDEAFISKYINHFWIRYMITQSKCLWNWFHMKYKRLGDALRVNFSFNLEAGLYSAVIVWQ